MSRPRPEISIVVPVFNEHESLPILHEEIDRHLGALGRPFEVLYVDDRSTDGSFEVLLALRAAHPQVRVVRFRRNCGQTAAMAAGFEYARGSVVVTLDADLQNDPADIPRLVAELEGGYDLVVGWRRERQDGFFLRRLPSRLANRLIALWTGARVHDTGCTLKAFRAALVRNLPIYSEQHRFLPVLALASGARIAEVVVNHRARRFGTSKYGLERALRVLFDLLVVKMLSSFSRAPLQYFVLLALPFVAATGFVFVTGIGNLGNLAGGTDWFRPVLVVLALLVMTGVYFVLLGLLAELVVKASDLHRPKVFDPLSTRIRP